MKIDFSRLPELINPVYYKYLFDRNRYNIFYGGAGSGKSHFIHQRNAYRLTAEPGHNFVIIRNVARSNRISTWPGAKQLISQWGLSSVAKYNETEMRISFEHNGNSAIFLGLDDVEKIKSITFANGPLTDIWIEEASEISQDDFMQLDLRLRGIAKQPFQITMSFNPISVYHWIKEQFFDKHVDNCTILKTTYKDNLFLDDGYKKRLESLGGNFKSVYTLGEWGQQEGLVFTEFQISDISSEAKLYAYGLDFGFSSDPCALIAVYETKDSIYLDEMIYETGLTNPDLSKRFKENEINRYAKIIADSQEPKSIEELYRLGWNVHKAKKGPDSIRYGITAMKAKKIFITPSSSNLIKEFYTYSWKKDKYNKMLPEPEDTYNHGIDAVRYVVIDMTKGKAGVPNKNYRALLGI